MSGTAQHHPLGKRPLLGLRRQPGRVALAAMRVPRPLYHRGWGWMLDHLFLLIAHQGRRTGTRHETVAMPLAYDPATREVVVCSAWGPNTEWMRNLRAHPALQIQIGRESYVPEQRFLSEDESVAAVAQNRELRTSPGMRRQRRPSPSTASLVSSASRSSASR